MPSVAWSAVSWLGSFATAWEIWDRVVNRSLPGGPKTVSPFTFTWIRCPGAMLRSTADETPTYWPLAS